MTGDVTTPLIPALGSQDARPISAHRALYV
jgi:hypothetical protein